MPEAFKFREFVRCCVKRFDAKPTIIQIKEGEITPMPLTPTTFREILCLLETNNVLELPKVNVFLEFHDVGIDILKECLS
jgi:hypothetical protein